MARNVDLLEGSIVGSLTSLALPIMATSLIQMAYNMTDMIWIGRLSRTQWRRWGRRVCICGWPTAWADPRLGDR